VATPVRDKGQGEKNKHQPGTTYYYIVDKRLYK